MERRGNLKGMRLAVVFLLVLLMPLALWGQGQSPRWWKGNLHTHTLWSDGDDYPEMVADWYKSRGYHFLALSDHNVLSVGERWFDATTGRGAGLTLAAYLRRFGEDWVEIRRENGKRLVRLKTLDEVRAMLEQPGRFLMIQSEEISDAYDGKPIHVNATNIQGLIRPQGGNSVYETMQRNVDAVLRQRERSGVPMFPHINHPNFGWAVTAEDLMPLRGEKFFEVYNGHPAVHNYGDATHSGTERMWDIVLTARIAELGLPVMYGVAVDDAHNYHDFHSGASNPGRAWVMVRAQELSAEAIVAAMERGDFYSSTGVTLRDVRVQGRYLVVEIEPEDGVEYTTTFYGTRLGYDASSTPVTDASGNPLPVTRIYSRDVGKVLSVVKGTTAIYELDGDEIYVRAKVVSSKPKANPYREGETEMAWTQPHTPRRG